MRCWRLRNRLRMLNCAMASSKEPPMRGSQPVRKPGDDIGFSTILRSVRRYETA